MKGYRPGCSTHACCGFTLSINYLSLESTMRLIVASFQSVHIVQSMWRCFYKISVGNTRAVGGWWCIVPYFWLFVCVGWATRSTADAVLNCGSMLERKSLSCSIVGNGYVDYWCQQGNAKRKRSGWRRCGGSSQMGSIVGGWWPVAGSIPTYICKRFWAVDLR